MHTNTRRRIASAFAIVLVGLTTAACSTEASKAAEESVKQDWIKDKCREAATDWLKSPGSAEFSGERVSSSGGYDYTVVGSVDSQNGFGAMLRSTYACEATSSDGDAYNFSAVVVGD